MKRGWLLLLAIAAACLLWMGFYWNPFARVDMEQATVILPTNKKSTPPPAGKGDVLAIIFSGDGGWSDLDKKLGRAFSSRGIPVLGVTTFTYYWRARTAEESATQLDALMTKYLGLWHKDRIWLIGFSFGADVLPTIIGELSPENRERISQLVLLAPSHDVNFEIELEAYMTEQSWLKEHIKTWLAAINPIVHTDALPPLVALDGKPPVVCYYGRDTADDSLCTEPKLPHWVSVHRKHGDHHFDGAYKALAQEMLDELPARSAIGSSKPKHPHSDATSQ